MEKIDYLIIQRAGDFKIDPDLVRAIVWVESSGNPWVTRFEKNWKHFFHTQIFAERLGITQDTETVHQATSWGLTQVMGTVARELGFQEELTKLCLPDLNLFYGCKKIKQLTERYGLETDVIASYNAGSVILKHGSTFYINEVYVDKVYKKLRELRALK